MGKLNRIWKDIKRTENIDSYLLIVLAVAVAILNIFNIVPEGWMPSITLGILGILVYSNISLRMDISEVHAMLSGQTYLLERFPEDLWDRVEREASEIWLVGATLYHIFSNNSIYALFQKKLKEKCVIKVLLRDPTDEMCQYASRHNLIPSKPGEMKSRIESTLDRLCELKELTPRRLEIRVIDYPLPFNIGVINPQKRNGTVFVEYHPYKMPIKQGSIPKIVIVPEDKYWYEFYITQFKTVWADGEEWPKSPQQRQKPHVTK